MAKEKTVTNAAGEPVPPLNGIHEAALYVADLVAAEGFWTTLGFEVVGRTEGRHVFLRAGGDMLLIFDPRGTLTAGNKVPAHGAIGVTHIAFDVPDPAALDGWHRRVEAAGIKIEAEQEWPRGGRSFYFRDPDGNSIEFITRGSWG